MGELRDLMQQKVKEEKAEIIPKIIQLHSEKKDAATIAKECGVGKIYVEKVISQIDLGSAYTPKKAVKKEKKVIKNDMAASIIRDMTEAIREKQYRKAYHLANGDLEGVEQHNRREIAKLKRLAMNSIIIEAAKQQGKDAAELAQSLGIRVKDAVDIMGVKVQKEDGTVEYKERNRFEEER